VNVKPKRYALSDKPVVLYGDFLVIECEVYSPPSTAGRTVYVFLDDDDVSTARVANDLADLLRRFRSE
jgi:hypothetical protein